MRYSYVVIKEPCVCKLYLALLIAPSSDHPRLVLIGYPAHHTLTYSGNPSQVPRDLRANRSTRKHAVHQYPIKVDWLPYNRDVGAAEEPPGFKAASTVADQHVNCSKYSSVLPLVKSFRANVLLGHIRSSQRPRICRKLSFASHGV